MKKDLTMSAIDRQNILNNSKALGNIQKYIGIEGYYFKGEYKFTKNQLVEFYNVDMSTIDRYLSNNEEELKHNGYMVLKGKSLKEFKEEFEWLLKGSKTPQLAVFNFRTFLNFGMLLTESEVAKALRTKILDIVIDSLNEKVGGKTKYINQRDGDYLVAITKEPKYRKEFTTALHEYLEMGNYKYAYYTDMIYKAIFKENTQEYKRLLQLEEKENPRGTMYSEILNLIASFETGIASKMEEKFSELKRKLKPDELNQMIDSFSKEKHWEPLVNDAVTKMACRDYGFRDIVHDNIKELIKPLSQSDYDRFLGETSKDLIDRINEDDLLLDVFKRLNNR